MPISPARATAFDILLRVESADAYASDLLHSYCSQLSAIDRNLATELVMGVLRWRSLLDQHIGKYSFQPLGKLDVEVLTPLRLAAYQLEFLDRVPQRSAVHESVELVKRARKQSAVPFANAILRKMAATAKPFEAANAIRNAGTITELAENSAQPAWLVERWARHFGLAMAKKICEQNQTIPDTAIRIRECGTSFDEKKLENQGIRLSPGQLLSGARRVEAGDVTFTEEFRQGRLAIQDEASQLVGLLLGHGTRILDCCAAPGGKTRLIAERNPEATIFAVELHSQRARTLRTFVRAENVRVITADARQMPFNARFDRILVDAPCSGTGTMARNPEIKWKLNFQDLTDLQARQTAILQSAMQLLQPGGRLIYATCSLEPEENEEVMEKCLSSGGQFRLLDCRQELELLRAPGELVWQDADTLLSGCYLRTLPGVHPCDGFFAAIVVRK
jgi:16S rRNA (cytosine967-C5)-methyltransferase